MLKTIPVKEAHKRSGLSIDFLVGLIETTNPKWGDFTPPSNRQKGYAYKIYEVPFMEWLRERGYRDEAV